MNSTYHCIAVCNINVGGNEAQGSLSICNPPAHHSKAWARPPCNRINTLEVTCSCLQQQGVD